MAVYEYSFDQIPVGFISEVGRPRSERLVSDLKVEIVNVVATANLNQKVNLNAVAELEQAFYHLEVYHRAYIKDKNMKGKVSVFASGKMISIGTKSEKDASKDLNHVTKLLADTGIIKPTKIHPSVQNVVAVATLDTHLDLQHLAENAGVMYEPEQLPAAIYRPPRFPKVTMLIFSSGKMVLAGMSSTEPVAKVTKDLQNFIQTSEACQAFRSPSSLPGLLPPFRLT